MEAVDKGLVFIGYADPATEIEHGIVVLKGQGVQKFLQFLKSVTNLGRIILMGFCVGSVQLIQHSFTIRIAGVKCMVLSAPLQQLQQWLHCHHLPKCGCDVNSAAKSMQVAKFTKYSWVNLVVSVV